jgi:hypothetical protein
MLSGYGLDTELYSTLEIHIVRPVAAGRYLLKAVLR